MAKEEKTSQEMALELGLNPNKFMTTDKKILDGLKKAYDFKTKKRAK